MRYTVDDLTKMAPIPTTQWVFGPVDIDHATSIPRATVQIIIVDGVPRYRWVGISNGRRVCYLSDTVRPSAKVAAFVWARWVEIITRDRPITYPESHPVSGDLGTVPL